MAGRLAAVAGVIRLACCLSICCFEVLFGQNQVDTLTFQPLPESKIDVNFLFNYYEQDGTHSAVTGGEGTQELKDQAGKILVHLPLDSLTEVNIEAGLNHYTSASTDAIDFQVSSASAKDNRAQFHIGFLKGIGNTGQSWGLSGGGSIESDYISSSVAGSWIWQSADENRIIALDAQAFFDTWIVIFPEELRTPGLVSVPTDKRRSFNLAASWSQVINTRMQAALSGEIVWQNGLLSTPFHRVYFQGQEQATIEKLPLNRLKFPLGIRLNYFISDFMVSRLYYRWYYDSFDILAHTASIDLPIKFGIAFSVYPHYRFHYQSAAKWFAPFRMHEVGATFYTSDFDLSGFHSHKFGLGIRYSPVYGIGRFRVTPSKIGLLKEIELRASSYLRSDGLKASTLGLTISFEL